MYIYIYIYIDIICYHYRLHEMIRDDNLPISMINGNKVPLCMQSYKLLFKSCRVPGYSTDKILIHPTAPEHIIVIRYVNVYRID